APQDPATAPIYLDLHVGAVTSDLGAGASGAPGCQPAGEHASGNRGKLFAIARAADPSCQQPTDGNPFIEYAFGPPGQPVTSNLPAGQTLDFTFDCMASVATGGCGFEHQLEAVHVALTS